MPTPEQIARLSMLERATTLKSDSYQIRVRKGDDFFAQVARYRDAAPTFPHSVMLIAPEISVADWEEQAIRTQRRLASAEQ